MKKPHLELVTWEDAATDTGEWKSIKKYDFSPTVIETVGFVIYEDKKTLALLQSRVIKDGDVCNVFTIPKGTIIKRQRIKV